MRYALLVLCALVTYVSRAQARIQVFDAEDSLPVSAATVFSRSGAIIGLTDNDGYLSIPSQSHYPLTVRCLGYEPLMCPAGSPEVRLDHTTFAMHEVVVTPVDRPVIRILCYVREYASGANATDTLMSFNEHMADFFLPAREKVKGFKPLASPRFLSSRLYCRKTDSSGRDSIFVPRYRDDSFAWYALVEMPYHPVIESERIHCCQSTDTVPGKYGIKQLLRKNARSTYIVQTDYLADSKNHKISPFLFKLLGFTIDITELEGSWVYRANEKGEYTPVDIVSGTFSLSILGRGKWIRKAFNSDSPIRMYSFYEIYPVEVQYLTVDEAKEMLGEHPPRVSFTVSPNARPLDPAIQYIIDHCSQNAAN